MHNNKSESDHTTCIQTDVALSASTKVTPQLRKRITNSEACISMSLSSSNSHNCEQVF